MSKTSFLPEAEFSLIENRLIPRWFLRTIIMACGISIINIWPIANSIAARNIALTLGALASLVLIFQNLKSLTTARLITPYFLLSLTGWVLLLYFFRPTLPEVQWREITSTWLRVVLALFLGTGMGLVISTSKLLRMLGLLAFLPLLAVQVAAYLNQSALIGSLATPFTPGIFITKAGGTYFLMWPFLFLCAYADYSFNSAANNFKQSNGMLKIGFTLLMLAVCFLAFYSLASLNGILIASICAAMLAGRAFMKIIVSGKQIAMGAAIISAFMIIGGFSMHTYSKYDDNKLNNLAKDIAIGAQIDRYHQWRQADNPKSWSPILEDGYAVNGSTYFRVASFVNGIRLISEYPLGAGFTYLPYGYYMSRIYPGSVADHTHSGWVDFTLGVGIPGLILCWLAMIWVIMIAIKNQKWEKQHCELPTLWNYIVIWGLGGITMLWVVLEVSEKEYIEHLMFMIAFLAAGNVILPPPKEKAVA